METRRKQTRTTRNRTNDKQRRILIAHGVTDRNLGDLAIIWSILIRIREEIPDVLLRIVTPYESQHLRHIDLSQIDCQEVPDYFTYEGGMPLRYRIRKLISGALKLLKLSIYTETGVRMFFSLKELRAIKLYEDADLVIGGWGEKFLDVGKGFPLWSVYPVIIALLLGKRVVISSATIGPFNGFLVRQVYRLMLSRMTLVLVREPLSLARAKELGIGPITFLTADEAFLLPRLRSKRVDEILESLKTEKIVVGISVRNWNFPMAVNPYKERKKYENAIVESVDAIVHKTGAKVLIAVHNIHERVANDYSIALRIFRRVRFPERLTVLPTSLLPQEEKEILAHVDVFVGTRLHSNIFSLGVETPVIAISYSPKTVGVMSMLDLSDWMIPIEDFCNDPKILCPKVQKLLDRSVRERYIARLRPRLSEVTGAARSNARFIRMILSNRPELVVSEGPRSRTSQDEWLE